MEEKNSLIITEAGKPVFVGEEILSYIDLKRDRPFAYPAGRIERDDAFLFVSRNAGSRERLLLQTFGMSGEEAGRGGGALLFLGVYGNDEVQPVEKSGARLFGAGEAELLDTFFFGNEIRIVWEREKVCLCVTINGQTVRCSLAEGEGQLLIFCERGIRYFRDDCPESRRDDVESVLGGHPFHAYLRKEELGRMDMESMLAPSVLDRLKSIGPGNETFFSYNGRQVCLSCRQWQLGGTEYYGYTIVTRQDVLDEISEASALYQRLEEAGQGQSGGKRMSTTFRLWGNDDSLTEVRLLLQKACDTNVTVLLTGESGTGKTFLAKEIHKNSRRQDRNFIHVNCAAIPYQIIESELFGYEDGAFTGARRGGRKGYFEMADGGTIFLDEIAELPLSLQGKLLEVLQNKTFYRVGGTEKISVSARLIAATNRDLKELVSGREFREDLYYRINVFPIELPPLRRRTDAIRTIVTDILPEICRRVELEPLMISPQALEKMKGYDWPGNIRELENVLEKAAILCDGKIILQGDVALPQGEPFRGESAAATLREQRERCEKKAILTALNRWGGDRAMAARSLDIGRTNLFEKMKKYNIRSSFTGGEDDTE